MNAKFVALALGCIVCLPSPRQAQLSKVVVYGSLNVDIEWITGATCPSAVSPPAASNCTGTDPASQIINPTVMRVSSNSSRLGVRGSEYLGSGQVAIFQLESSVQADTGNSPNSGIASRETFVGLQGDWGTFKAGKFLTPYHDILPIFGNAPTLTTSGLSPAALWAQ